METNRLDSQQGRLFKFRLSAELTQNHPFYLSYLKWIGWK
ncbi:hypothetical protein NEOC95_001725 [Neochlamydia sp. AcF95]|nr:hypothetical protein [Neochlamydia sp. AcF95]